MKNVLSVQSSVVYGYAGNKAAVLPMQLSGIDVWPFYTVQFSNHTQYGMWQGMVMPHGIALRQLLQVIQPADDGAQLAVRHRHALPHPVLGVVGKLYGVKRPDIDPRKLHRQHSGFISGIAIND